MSALTRIGWLAILCVLVPSGKLPAQADSGKTAAHVKIDASAGKWDPATGKQIVTLTIDIDEKHMLMGRKMPEDLLDSRLDVTFMIAGKPAKAEVVYPAGIAKREKIIGDYEIYRGKIVVTAVLTRPAGDGGPVEAVVGMQGFPYPATY